MASNEVVKSNKLVSVISILKSSKLFWIGSFTILTAITAQFAIPIKPVPFTLQTMMVLIAGAVLGAKKGAYSQILYLALGAIGLPVFANGTMGIGVLFGPTGGYLLAFPIAAYLVGYLVEKNQKYYFVVISMFASNILILLLGTLYLNTFFIHNFSEAFKAGAAIFSVWMVAKIFTAAAIYFLLSKKLGSDNK